MKTIIAGGRNYIPKCLDVERLNAINITEVVSGGSSGADKFGENYAEENNIPIKLFTPEWKKFGRAADMIRNNQMAKYAEALVLFTGGKGTDNMHITAIRLGVKHIYDFRGT